MECLEDLQNSNTKWKILLVQNERNLFKGSSGKIRKFC